MIKIMKMIKSRRKIKSMIPAQPIADQRAGAPKSTVGRIGNPSYNDFVLSLRVFSPVLRSNLTQLSHNVCFHLLERAE